MGKKSMFPLIQTVKDSTYLSLNTWKKFWNGLLSFINLYLHHCGCIKHAINIICVYNKLAND